MTGIFRFIISFFLFASIFGFITLACAGYFLMRYRPLFMAFDNNGYIESIEGAVRDRFASIGIPSGIPETVFDNIGLSGIILDDVQNTLVAMMDGRSYIPNTKTLYDNLFKAFMDYAESIDIHIDEDISNTLEELAGICVTEYIKVIEFPFHSQFSSFFYQIKRFATFALPWIVFAIALFMQLCRMINLPLNRSRIPRDIGVSMIAAGAASAGPGVYLLITAPLSKLNVNILSFTLSIEEYFNYFFYAILICGIILAISGTILVLVKDKNIPAYRGLVI